MAVPKRLFTEFKKLSAEDQRSTLNMLNIIAGPAPKAARKARAKKSTTTEAAAAPEAAPTPTQG